MDYRSPLQDDYGKDCQPSYGGRYAPYTPRRTHQDFQGNRRIPSGNDQPSSSGYSGFKPAAKSISMVAGNDQPSSSGYGGRMPEAKYGDRHKPTRYPPELTALFGANECKLCLVLLKSPIVGKMHYAGKSHMKKVKKFLLEWSCKTGLPVPEINELNTPYETTLTDYCELCDITLKTTNDKILHYSGKSHQKNERDPLNAKKRKKKYETIDISGRFGIGEGFSTKMSATEKNAEVDTSNNTFVCKLCDLHAISEDQLNKHFKGKMHILKLKKHVKKLYVKDNRFKCSLCDVSLESQSLLDVHLRGKRHIKALMKMEMSQNVTDVNYTQTSCPKELTDLFGDTECKLCAVLILSPELRESHYSGNPHMTKVNNFMSKWNAINVSGKLESVDEESTGNYYCQLCEISLPSFYEKVMHKISEIHLKKKFENNGGKKRGAPSKKAYNLQKKASGVPKKDTPFSCSICDVHSENLQSLQAHLLGAKHKKNIEKIGMVGNGEDIKDNV